MICQVLLGFAVVGCQDAVEVIGSIVQADRIVPAGKS